MKKMLVSDFDRTFYINDNDIENNIHKVKAFRDNKHIFIIATGRSYYDFNQKLQEYPMEYDYLIINQGATILDSKGCIIENYTIEETIKDRLIEELALYDQDTMFACSILESRVSIKNKKITKIHKRYDTLQQAKAKNEEVNQKYAKHIISYLIPSSNAIEIIASQTNKAEAIKKIAVLENIANENIFTIGDSYNDIEMITSFNGYCVKNAEDEVKEISHREYESVSELIDELLKEDNQKTKS